MNKDKMMENMKKGEIKAGLIATAGILGIMGLIAVRKKKAAMEKIKSGCAEEGGMLMMPQMMMKKMMPHCLKKLLPKLSKEDRNDFVLKMASILFAEKN